jgi:amino acid adenylation domain-containing protein
MAKLDSFERLSPAKQKLFLARLRKREAALADAIPESPLRATGGPFPLSFPQQRLWFLARLAPDDPSHNVIDAFAIRGPLSVATLRRALLAIVTRHESLRTRFDESAGTPTQTPLPPAEVAVPTVDLGALPAAAGEEEAERLTGAFVLTPFDVARGPHLKALLLALPAGAGGEALHRLLISIHHIVTDGWSMAIFERELGLFYGALAVGLAPSAVALPALPVQYPDFADWQRRLLAGEPLERLLGDFTERIAGAPTVLELPADRPRPAVRGFRGAQLVAEPPGFAEALDALARQPGDTRFMALVAIFSLLLSRLSGSRDLLVGSPIANRTRLETEGLIGYFVNTLVLRARLDALPAGAGFADLLAQVRQDTLAAYTGQDLPFERAVEELNPERDLARSPLFQVTCAFLPPAAAAGPDLGPLRLEAVRPPAQVALFDLGLEGAEIGPRLLLEWRYSTDLFDAVTVERFAARLAALVAAAAADPARPLASLPLLDAAERRQLLDEWQGGPAIAAAAPTLHGLFERQAARRPEATAVVAAGHLLCYGELDRRATAFARRLAAEGVGPEVRVGLALPRSLELVVATLAVLKAGGAYVPLDPGYPRERLELMAADAGVSLVLGAMGEVGGKDMKDGGESGGKSGGVFSENLATVIYTSGSTGRPKGVAIAHASAVALMGWAGLALGEDEGVLGQASVSFDMWAFELFAPLCHGGVLVLAESLLAFPGMVERDWVTEVNAVPSLMAEMLRQGALPSSVRRVHLGGEAPGRDLIDRLHAQGPAVEVWNGYGPTEDTTWSTFALQARGESGPPLLGLPIAGGRAHVLDDELEPVAVGVPGELFLGGAGLARGYLDRPELTAARFVPDPFAGRSGERLYRTGDRARRHPSGALESLGRLDGQVKLFGFRIELGDVEAALASHPRVFRAAAVVVDGTRLVAFAAPEGGTPPSGMELLAYLRGKLPAAMVPAEVHLLPALPLSPNGKVDRRVLTRLAAEAGAAEWVAPATELERRLAAHWGDLLGAARVGASDDFFALGGHSLLATQLVSRIEDEIGVVLPIAAIFEHRRLSALAAEIERLAGESHLDELADELAALSEEEIVALLAAEAAREAGRE